MLSYLVSDIDQDNFERLKSVLRAAEPPTVAFVGAGLSMANGYVSWHTLVERLAASLGLPSPRTEAEDLLATTEKVWTKCAETYGTTAPAHFRGMIRECLQDDTHAPYSSAHLDLLRTDFSAFLTTNFDPSISLAANTLGRTGRTETYDPGSNFPEDLLRTGTIYHIHGRLWDHEGSKASDPIVFLPSEYTIAYGHEDRPGRVARFLEDVMNRCHIVFLGYGMNDPAFQALMAAITQDAALRRFVQQQRHLQASPSSTTGPHWFRLVGLPDEGQFTIDQCLLDHRRPDETSTVIHYKHTQGTGKRDEWGLSALLRDLSQECPYTIQAIPAVIATAPIADTAAPLPAAGGVSPTVPPAPTSSQGSSRVSSDLNETLSRVEELLVSQASSAENVTWLLTEFVDAAVLDFAVRTLVERPDLLRTWLPIFFNARLLSVPPQVIQEGGQTMEPYWYAGRLLEAGARRGLPIVVDALEAVQGAGLSAAFYLLRAFNAFTDLQVIARLSPSVAAWLHQWSGDTIDVPELANRVVLLLTSGYPTEAALLLNALLESKPAPEVFGFRRADSRIDRYWIHYLAQNQFPQLATSHPAWLAHHLEVRLRQLKEWEAAAIPAYSPPALAGGSLIKTIEHVGEQHDEFAEQLTAALRNTMAALIRSDPHQAAVILYTWLTDRLLVFRRLALYLVAEYGTSLPELIPIAIKRENLEIDDCRPEFWKLLNLQFAVLPDETRLEVESWILDYE